MYIKQLVFSHVFINVHFVLLLTVDFFAVLRYNKDDLKMSVNRQLSLNNNYSGKEKFLCKMFRNLKNNLF